MLDESIKFEAKKSKNAGRHTWIPEPKTSEYYQALGLDYYEDPRETMNRRNLQKCSYEYERQVKTVYRIRTNDRKEWLTWYELRTGKTQLGSPIKGWVVYVGLNWKPIPTYTVEFDNETQQQIRKASGLVGREKEYAVSFTQENLDDLSIEINEFDCNYIIMHDERDKFTIDLNDFKTKDFDALYKNMFKNRIEISSKQKL
jgi:hypothetical protein